MKHYLKLILSITILIFTSCMPKNLNGFYQNEYSHKLEIIDSTFQITTYDGMNGIYYCNGILKTKGDSIMLKQNTEQLKEEYLNVYKCDSMILIRKNNRKIYNKEYLFKRIK